jgi:hypothetical protein
VLDINAATAPGNILSRTESLRTESTSALSLSDRLFALIANWPLSGANDAATYRGGLTGNFEKIAVVYPF